jgi:hypothetical protein
VLLDEAAHRRAASARRVAFRRRHGAVRVAVEALRRRGALGVEFLLRDRVVAVGVDLGVVRETGGLTALEIGRERFKSTQARFGFDYEKQAKAVQINANAQLVWEFEDGPQLLGANFAGGTGPNANFVLDTADHNWVELGVSASIDEGPFRMTFGADTTAGRDSADAQVVRASATYRF